VHDSFGVLEVSPDFTAPVADENKTLRVEAEPRDLSLNFCPTEPSMIPCNGPLAESSSQMTEQFTA